MTPSSGRYLVQDYAFVWTLTGVFGYAVGQAPTMDAKASLTGFLGTLTDEENDYFERSFDALGVSPDERTDPVPADATEAFEDLLTRAALEGEYEETLAVLVPAEWIYLTWATAAPGVPEEFYLREWIELHDTSEFEAFVAWLRSELDEYGPSSASADSIASRDSSAEPWLSKSRSSRWPTLDILPRAESRARL